MITIPTSELIGGISDVLAFAPDDKEDPFHGVLISWDGDALRFSAFDVLSGGASTWVPGLGDERVLDDQEDVPEAFDVRWGDDDSGHSWSVFVNRLDAKEIVKVYKLAAKFALTPVTIETNWTGTRLIIARKRQEWCTQHTMTVDTPNREIVEGFPDITELTRRVSVVNGNADPAPMTYSPVTLARFGAVRFWPAELTWCGPDNMTTVKVGDRFSGFLFPSGAGRQTAAKAVSGRLDLRHGSGVHVSPGTVTEPIDLRSREVDEDGPLEPGGMFGDGIH